MRWHSLRLRLTAWFLVVALLPLSILMGVIYVRGKETLRRELFDRLKFTAEERVQDLDLYARERLGDALALAASPAVAAALENLTAAFTRHGLESPEYAAVAAEIRPYLGLVVETYGYHDLLLVSVQGDVVFSVAQEKDLGTNLLTGVYKATPLARAFRNVSTLLEAEISDFSYYAPSARVSGFLAAPVLCDRAVVGVLALQLNLRHVEALVKEYRGLGESGETLVVARVDDEVVFLTATRGDPAAAFRRKVSLGGPQATPAQQAVLGRHGEGPAVDYLGHEVLAVWRYLPRYRWGIVTKMDRAEAFAPITQMEREALGFGLGAGMLVVIAAVAASRGLARPVLALRAAAQRLAAGDFSRKAQVTGHDEIAQLAAAFNDMADKVAARTQEITTLNTNLCRRAAELEVALAESEEFAYAAAHHLGQPLRGIDGFCQVVLEEDGNRLSPEGRRCLGRAREAAQRLAGILEELQQLARLSRRRLKRQPTDLSALVRTLADRLRQRDAQRSAKFIVADGLVADCDADLVGIVLEALLENAWKFTAGRTPARIEFGAAPQPDGTQAYFVRDNGVGFDMAYADKLFVPFQRLHGPEEFPGRGMGLAVVQRIIRRHGGRVWAEGAVGQGATFYFTL